MMDLTPVQMALLTGLPTAGSLATLGYFGWNRTKRQRFAAALAQEEQRRAAQLDGASILRHPDAVLRRGTGFGQVSFAGAGGYFSRQLPYTLHAFERANVGDFVSGILLVEFDQSEAQLCLRNIPPAFTSRVVVVPSPLLPAGGQGWTVEDALANQHLWWHDVHQSVERWLSLIQHDHQPAVLAAYPSTSGMAALLKPALEAYQERYPQNAIYTTLLLDHKTVVRQRFPTVRQLYTKDDLVRGTIVLDNTRHTSRSDLGAAVLPAAMTASGWLGTLPLQLWNGLSYLFAKEGAVRYATLSVWAEMLPVHYLPSFKGVLPEVYYTQPALVEEKILRGIKYVFEHPDLQAVPLARAARGHTRLIYVIAPLVPEPFFNTVSQRVDANLAPWKAATDPDLHINYASIGAPLSPQTTETPLIIVLVQPLADDGRGLDAYALGSNKPPALSVFRRS